MKLSSWRRLPHLCILALALTLSLSACLGLSTTPSAQSTISISNPGSLSPTPTAPAYLVGAYVNNNTFTNNSGNLIVYVIFHHGQLPQAGGQASLYFHYENGGGISGLNNQAGAQATGADGFATFKIFFRGLSVGTPISIDVTVTFPGIANITEADATSFTIVNVIPTAFPTPRPTQGG
jgi:hypothetical protein